MASPPLKAASRDDRLYNRIKAKFIETVNPKHLIPHLSLCISDEEEVLAVQKQAGQTNAAAELLRKICRHPDWFHHLLKALTNHSVGLEWLANEFEKCQAELLVEVNIHSVTLADPNGGEDINMPLGTEEDMEVDEVATPEQMMSFHQMLASEQMDYETYNQHRLKVLKQCVLGFINDLVQTPEQLTQILPHLTEICQTVCSGAQLGCLELLLCVDSLSMLYLFEEYYKGGAIQDALEADLTAAALNGKMKKKAEEYGLKIKSLHISVSIKEKEFEECARYFRSIKDSTARRSYLDAKAHPLSVDMPMHCDTLESQHSWPQVYQDMMHDVFTLMDDDIQILKCSDVAKLTEQTLHFMERHYQLKDELLKDVTNIWYALLCCNENNKNFVPISSNAGVTSISLEEEKVAEFSRKYLVHLDLDLSVSVNVLLHKEILTPVSGVENGYVFSSILLRDYVAHLIFNSSGQLHGSCSDGYRHIFHAYSRFSKDNSAEWVSFLSKLGSLQQLHLVILAASWSSLHAHSLGTTFLKDVLDFDLLDLCDEGVISGLKQFKKVTEMIESLEVKICSVDIAQSIGSFINQMVIDSPKQLVILPPKVSFFSLSEFDAVLKVLSIFELGPSTRKDKEKENRLQTHQSLFLKKIGAQSDRRPSFEVDFSSIDLSPEKVKKLCLYVPGMQHVSRYIFNQTKLNRETTMTLLSLMDPFVVKGISLSDCSLNMKSGPVGLSRLSKLEYLDLEHTDIEDAGLSSLEQELKGLDNLKELNVGSNSISLVGLLQLSLILVQKINLVALRIHGNQFGESAGSIIGVLVSRLQRLEVLSVWGCDLQDFGMVQLAEFLSVRKLKRLSLRDNNIKGQSSVEVFNHLALCESLLFFDYNNNAIIPLGEETETADSISKAVLTFLTGSKCWDYLNFWNCNIGKSTIFDSFSDLKCLHSVTQLCLQTNKIDDDMAKKLSEYFQNTKYLQHLNLRQNDIGDVGIISLASAIAGLRYLKDLWLDWNRFGYRGAQSLIDVALTHPSLVDCNLSYSYQLSPPEKQTLLQKFQTVNIHEDVFVAKYEQLTVLM